MFEELRPIDTDHKAHAAGAKAESEIAEPMPQVCNLFHRFPLAGAARRAGSKNS